MTGNRQRLSPTRRGIAVVPTLLTLGNGICGFAAIAKIIDASTLPDSGDFSEKVIQAAWLIFLGMIFDTLDGRVARLTNQTTEFGVQLDSCTDVVTFGVAPALLVKVIYEQAMTAADLEYNVKLTFCLTALYTVCAILRLARFSAETESEDAVHHVFSGLPTPAGAGIIASAVFFIFEGDMALGFEFGGTTQLGIKMIFLFLPPALGLLMVSRVRYVHVGNRFIRGRKTYNFLAQVIICMFLVAFCHEWTIFLFFLGYVFSGPLMATIGLFRSGRPSPWSRIRNRSNRESGPDQKIE